MITTNRCFSNMITILTVITIIPCFAQEWFMLPYPGGKSYKVTQGNFDDPKINQITPATYRTHLKSSMKFAFDFAMPLGDSVVAPAPCVVSTVSKETQSNSYNSGFGDVVVVIFSDKTYGKFAHLSKFSVIEGQALSRGQLIAFSGKTGIGTGPHLHYQRQDRAAPYGGQTITYETLFKDVYHNNGKPLQGYEYTSHNFYNSINNFIVGKYNDGWHSSYPSSRPFALSYLKNGGTKVIGWPQSDVHEQPLATGYWIQDFEAFGNIIITLVLSSIAKLSKWIDITSRESYFAYPLVSQMRSYWLANNSLIGTPISNEYFDDIGNIRYTVQLFYNEPLGVGVIYEIRYNNSNGTFTKNALSSSNIHIAENSIAVPVFSGNGIGGGDIGLEDEDTSIRLIYGNHNINHDADGIISIYDLLGRKSIKIMQNTSSGIYVKHLSNKLSYKIIQIAPAFTIIK